jgi:argininosuccinate lyase
MHLSRFAEEIVIWNSREFGFVELDDSVATGSSLMPQKKNPDVAELLRGKTGRLYGDLISLLTVLKGLPLTYNKDLQEDKEPIFDAADTTLQCLQAAKLLVETTKFRTDVMEQALEGSFANSTDIADELVRRGVPFRKAHEIVGQSIKGCIAGDKSVKGLEAESDMKGSVEARNIPGGTSSEQVRKQIEAAKRAVTECGI